MSLLSFRDTLKVLLFVAIFYVGPGVLYLKHVRDQQYEREQIEVKNSITSSLEYINGAVYAGFVDEICSQLRADVRSGRLEFFAFESATATCSEPEGSKVSSYPVKNENQFTSYKADDRTLVYLKSKIEDAQIVLGSQNPKPQSLSYYFTTSGSYFLTMAIAEILLVVWMVFGFIFLFITVNLNRIKSLYANSSAVPPRFFVWLDRIANLASLSDVSVMEGVVTDQSRVIKELRSDLIYSDSNLLYSVQAEMNRDAKAGKPWTLPFRFSGTVVRADINGYTNVMTTMSPEVVEQVNRTFKRIAAELARRYEGLFESSAGDEVIYCFRGKRPTLQATAFARDLMREYSEVTFYEFPADRGNAFRLNVKASVYPSELSMSRGDARMEFDGLGLLYTERMLGSVPTKDRNTLVITPSVAQELQALIAKMSDVVAVTKKTTTIDVLYVSEFAPRSGWSEESSIVYRSDMDIRAAFDSIALSSQPDGICKYLSVVLKSVSVGSSVIYAWEKCVESALSNSQFRRDFPTVLPSLISFGSEIVPLGQWTTSQIDMLKRAIKTLDERVRENALDVIIRSDLLVSVGKVNAGEDRSSRLKANLLLADVLFLKDEESVKRLITMVKSKSDSDRLSAIFAAATLIDMVISQDQREIAILRSYRTLLTIINNKYNSDEIQSERIKALIQKSLVR